MNKTEFFNRVADILEYDGQLTSGINLESIETWDSLGVLLIVGLLEELGVEVDTDAVSSLQTTDQLAAMAESVISDD